MQLRVMTWVGLVMLTCSACHPPTHGGFISMQSRQAGALDISASAGGGAPIYVGGGMQVEPYATPELSIPVTVNAGWGGGTHEVAEDNEASVIQWYLSGRVGARYRFRELVSVGLGVGGGYRRSIDYDQPVGPPGAVARDEGAVHVDIEIGVGHRWERFGVSFAVRPTWDAIRMIGFHLPLEAAFAWYPVDDTWALVVSGIFDMSIPGITYGGAGSVGFMFHL